MSKGRPVDGIAGLWGVRDSERFGPERSVGSDASGSLNSALHYSGHSVPRLGTGHTRSTLDVLDHFARLSPILCQLGRRVAVPDCKSSPNHRFGRAEPLRKDIDLSLILGGRYSW
jgi:hypothetical protein